MQACCQEDGSVPILVQILEGDITSKRHSCPNFYPQVLNSFDFMRKDIFWQTIRWYTYGHHAARNGQFFKDCYLVSISAQEIGCGQASRTRPDDGHFFVSRLFDFRDIWILTKTIVISYETFDGANC